jgi:hypothetical protein
MIELDYITGLKVGIIILMGKLKKPSGWLIVAGGCCCELPFYGLVVSSFLE